MSDQSDLRNFQRSLNENDDEKNHYLSNQIENDIENDLENDLSEEESEILSPKKSKTKTSKTKSSKTTKVDAMLMEQLIIQQKAYLKAQRTIYKLRNEIDTEEVKNRYVKLDLNNAQVRIGELTKMREKFYKLIGVNVFVLFLVISILTSRIF